MTVAEQMICECGHEAVDHGPGGGCTFDVGAAHQCNGYQAVTTGIKPHVAHFEWCEGATFLTVVCPDEAMGDKRPCAPWGAEYDDGTRMDECALKQYADALEVDEFLHGTVKFDIRIKAAGYGEDFHGEVI